MGVVHSQAESKRMLEKIMKHGSNLNEWEYDFVNSVTEVVNEGGRLTPKQREKIGEVWDRLRLGVVR